jgi:hypothetical protein
MAVTRLSQSSLREGLEKYTTALGNYVPSLGVIDSIQTVTVGAGGTSSITFSGISSRFQHLHLRYVLPSSVTDNNFIIRFNGDTGANYTIHELNGNGASAGAGAVASVGFIRVGYWQTGTLSQPYYGVVDILDVSSTSKNTTVRAFNGVDTNGGDGFVRLNSGLWNNTAAVTSVTFSTVQSNVPQNSVVHLYGVLAR